MVWVQPTAIMHVPPGGEYKSMIANGVPRALAHSGVDHSRWEGNDVVSIGAGTVLRVGSGNTGWGNHIYIDHGPDGGEPDGPNVPHIISFYAHMQAAPPFRVGDHVNAGTILGGIGRSGVQFAHLHWGMAVCGRAQYSTLFAMGAPARNLLIDPLAFLAQYATKPKPAKPNARTVGAGGAKRREEPTTAIVDNFDPAENLPPGAVVEWDGFVRSTMVGGQPGGDNIWLKKGSLYTSWTAMVPMTEAQGPLVGIPDLGFYPARLPKRTVTFVLDDLTSTTVTVEHGEPVPFPEAPTREGYAFDGWLGEGGRPLTAETVITRDSTFYATWAPVVVEPDPVDPDPGEPGQPDPVEPDPVEPTPDAPTSPRGTSIGALLAGIAAALAAAIAAVIAWLSGGAS